MDLSKPLRVTLLIDSLGSGGAQRQLCTLATLLKGKGVVVRVFTYHDDTFFKKILDTSDVEYQQLRGKTILRKIFEIRKVLRRGDQDVVLAYLPGPCVYAELAALPFRKWGLVVSERNAIPRSHHAKFQWQRILHRIADYVCTNSHTNRLMIEHSVTKLVGRVLTIYNVVDLEKFKPSSSIKKGNLPLKIIVAASHKKEKNLCGLIEALKLIKQREIEIPFKIHWYGQSTVNKEQYNECMKVIDNNNLGLMIELYPPSLEISELYKDADALGLFSFYEGLPNVVCEGMASGLPILMSNTCDAQNLVHESVNGLLFDPNSPEEIASTLMDFCALDQNDRISMGENSRKKAESLFDQEKFIDTYIDLLKLASKRSRELPEHWYSEVPESAYRSV